MYKAMYLPVDRPWTDGCIVIDSSGVARHWDENNCLEVTNFKERHKVAELFIVSHDFNQIKIVGIPSKAALKWIHAGMSFKHFNVETKAWIKVSGIPDPVHALDIRCDICGHMATE